MRVAAVARSASAPIRTPGPPNSAAPAGRRHPPRTCRKRRRTHSPRCVPSGSDPRSPGKRLAETADMDVDGATVDFSHIAVRRAMDDVLTGDEPDTEMFKPTKRP